MSAVVENIIDNSTGGLTTDEIGDDTWYEEYLPLAAGDMKGNIIMNKNRIRHVDDVELNDDVVNLKQLRQALHNLDETRPDKLKTSIHDLKVSIVKNMNTQFVNQLDKIDIPWERYKKSKSVSETENLVA